MLRIRRSSARSVTTCMPSTACHGQVNRPRLWWLTVGVRRAARAEPTAPMLIAEASNRMPVGQPRLHPGDRVLSGRVGSRRRLRHGWRDERGLGGQADIAATASGGYG